MDVNEKPLISTDLTNTSADASGANKKAPKRTSKNVVILIFALVLTAVSIAVAANYLLKPVVSCRVNNKTYKVGDTIPASDGCNSCTCGETGEIMCTLIACNPENSIEATVDTSNWQTYRNPEYGFEIAYPSTWMLTDDIADESDCTLLGEAKGIRINSDIQNNDSIYVWKINNQDMGLYEYFDSKSSCYSHDESFSFGQVIATADMVTFGDNIVRKLEEPPIEVPIADLRVEWFIFENGQDIYLVQTNMDSTEFTNGNPIFDEMLISFRFFNGEEGDNIVY